MADVSIMIYPIATRGGDHEEYMSNLELLNPTNH
jgi:hypothetical protein